MNPSEKMPEEILRRIYGVHFSSQSEEALQKRLRTQQLVQQLNLSFPEEYEKREKIFQNLFGHFGKDAHLEPPFHCDCGENIFIGDKTFLNFNVTILDSAEVRIGNNCWIAPNVQIYAATHPTDYLERRKICLAKPITIGNDVWIGGGSIIMKKRILALMMTGVMLVGCPVMALAEEAAEETEVMEEGSEEIASLDYTMIDETVYEGTWISAFDVFDLYLPSNWDVLVNADLNEEAPENCIYFQAANEEQTQSVAISYSPSELSTLDELASYYTDQGFEEVGYMYINEIPVVTYSAASEGIQTMGIVTLGDQGGVYNVTLGAPEDDSDFAPIAQNIVCSFSATASEEETETETE